MNTLLIISGLFVSAYSQTIVDLADADSRLSTLVGALTQAGLVDVLNGDGPFTVFAPTDDAFAAIEVPTNVTVLSNILQYHVLSGQVYSTDLESGLIADTIISQPISVQIGDKVSIYDTMGRKANVTEADIQGTNGVIHIIDNVILPDGTIADVTSNIASLSTLDGALVTNSLDTTLSTAGPFTLFAPTDDAIAAFAGSIDANLLLYHVLAAEYTSGDNGNIPDGSTVLGTADTGSDVTVISEDSNVYVKDAVGRIATVTMTNFATTNGVVHIIDIVLASSEFGTVVDLAVEDPRLTSLVGALTDANLVSTLADGAGTFTVFAPTNDAVAAFGNSITSEVLLYHVLGTEYLSGAIPDGNTTLPTLNTDTDDVIVMKNDDGVFVKDRLGRIATVTQADLQGTNGVIHIIDIVLEYRDIVDFAIEDSRLTELVQALTDANLVSALQAPNGPFTVFAPTDDAFDDIDVPENVTVLSNILLYHVVSGEVLSTDLYSGLIAETLQTESITVQLGDAVSIYDSMGMIAEVTEADIVGANGVIHIIDSVLSPGGNVVDIVSNTDSLSTLAGALTTEGLIDTLNGDGPFTVFAPTNDAIEAFGNSITAEVLTYHVLGGEYINNAVLLSTGDFVDIPTGNTTLATVNGADVVVMRDGDDVMVKDALGRVATVTMANIAGTNGVVHIIDIVLEYRDIVGLAVADSRLTGLVGALTTAGLVSALSEPNGPFTVFAPTDDAFADIEVPTNVTILSNILTYHVLADVAVFSTDLFPGLITDTLQGESITVQTGDAVSIYDSMGMIAEVTDANIEGSNGVIHVIDSVLSPGGDIVDIVSNTDSLSSLASALTEKGLISTLEGDGPYTVFAPTNEAIDAFEGVIDTELLLYHVLSGEFLNDAILLSGDDFTDIPTGSTVLPTANTDGDEVTVMKNDTGVFVQDALGRVATVTLANIAGLNGVVHIIDVVLANRESPTIVDLAVADDRLSTLVGALTAAGLVDVLSGDGPFTVFAPTNDAFDAITVPENVTVLSKVLQYHVVAGEVLSSALSSGLVATTIIDQTITCQKDDDGVFFYDSNGRVSQVTEADIMATNGVIHIVDSVLLPDGTLADITSNVDILSSLDGALIENGLDETLGGEGTFTVFAPTNDAVTAFVADGGEITSDVLLYHVLGDVFFSENIPDGETELETANTDGDKVTVINNATGIFVKDAIDRIATVTLANIAGTNGVAHVIDIVLSPTELETPEPTGVDESGVNRMSISVFCITFYFLAFLIFT